MFYRVTELITLLLEAREERDLLRLKKQLAKLDLLILDELGYVPTSQVGAELFFDVISTADERLSVVITTNLPFENWTEVLGSERLTGATLDRLTHRCPLKNEHGWKLPEKASVFKMPNDDAQNAQAQAKQKRHKNRENTLPVESLTST